MKTFSPLLLVLYSTTVLVIVSSVDGTYDANLPQVGRKLEDTNITVDNKKGKKKGKEKGKKKGKEKDKKKGKKKDKKKGKDKKGNNDKKTKPPKTKKPTASPTKKPTTSNVNVLVQFNSRSSAMSAYSDEEVEVTEQVGDILGMKTTVAKANSYKKDMFVKLVEVDHKMTTPPGEEVTESFVHILGAENTPWGIPAVLQDVQFWKKQDANGPKKICVVDTGFDGTHEDLPQEYVSGTNGVGEDWDFDGNGHGTHTAGTVSAIGGNKKGVVGIIPDDKGGNFQLLIGKALNKNGLGSASSVMKAVQTCVDNGANVISMSLGCNNCKTQIEEKFYRNLFKNKGLLLYAAAGNSGDAARSSPSSYPGVVSVASLESNWERSDFSQYNSQVEIAAPGGKVESTFLQNGYKKYSGTSMACPHAAGVATLLWMSFPSCKNYQIRNALDDTASNTQCDEYTGFGMVQAKDAYDLLSYGDCGEGTGSKDPIGGCAQLNEDVPPVAPPTKSPTKKPPTKKPKKKKNKKKKKKKKTRAPTNNPTPEPSWAPTGTDYPTATSTVTGSMTETISDSASGSASASAVATLDDCVDVQVVIRTDSYPEDTSFEVKDLTGEVVMSGEGLSKGNHFYSFDNCLLSSCYTFEIKDAWSDGICCGWGAGEYSLYYDEVKVLEGGVFTDASYEYFGDCE